MWAKWFRIILSLVSSLALIIAALNNPALAQQDVLNNDQYQIEMLFFEHTDPKRFEAENWPKFVGEIDTRSAISLSNLAPIDQISLVNQDDRLLNADEIIIKKSKEQRFIDHVAWTQYLPQNVRSPNVYIQAGENSSEIQALVNFKPIRNLFETSIDIIYTNASDNRQFRVTREIKLRKNEAFYLDHPIIGVMLIISRIVED